MQSAIIIVDLGADPALYNAARALAAKYGRKFRTFSTNPKKSEPFDLLQGLRYGLTSIQASNMFVAGTGHGGVFGKHGSQYFAGQAMFQVIVFIDWAIGRIAVGRAVSIKDIDAFLEDPANQIKDANQVRATIKQLSYYPQLMTGGQSANSIDLRRAVLDKEVVYFSCGTLGEEETARAIASIVIQTLIAVLKYIGENLSADDRGKPKPHAYLLVDEAQEVGAALHSVLSQGRKWGCSAIVAHQTSSQMKNVDTALLDVIRDNTSTKIYFTTTTADDVREIQGYSKDGIARRRSYRKGGGLIASGMRDMASESESEYETPLTDRNRILDANAGKGEFYLITDQDGHCDPIRTRADYTFSKAEYLRQLTTPLPDVVSPSNSANQKTKTIENRTLPWKELHRAAPDSERAQHLARVASMLQRIRNELSLS